MKKLFKVRKRLRRLMENRNPEEVYRQLLDAIKYERPLAFMQALVEKNPQALYHQNHHGWTVLAYACLRQAPAEVISWLLSQAPWAATAVDSYGVTPLYWTCHKSDTPLAVIQEMVRSAPSTMETVAKEGHVPLHWACYSSRPRLETISFLYHEWPVACLLENSDHKTPLDLARDCGASAESIQFLQDGQLLTAQALYNVFDVGGILTAESALLDWRLDDTQTLLRKPSVQAMVNGFVAIQQAEPGNPLAPFLSVVDNLDCLFLLLRQNPVLCVSSTRE